MYEILYFIGATVLAVAIGGVIALLIVTLLEW